MASMRDIKRRKSSISSTQQITKAMKLVSTVKLQKAKSRAEQTNPYFNYMYKTVGSMLAKSGNINHPYLNSGDSKRKAVVVITSNRGLAGGYNSNVVKLITQGDFNKEDLDIYAIGGKGADMLLLPHQFLCLPLLHSSLLCPRVPRALACPCPSSSLSTLPGQPLGPGHSPGLIWLKPGDCGSGPCQSPIWRHPRWKMAPLLISTHQACPSRMPSI